MIQYLQSWFPGWGGWHGDSQDPDRPEELLPSPSSWDILGERPASVCVFSPFLFSRSCLRLLHEDIQAESLLLDY